MFIDVEAGLFNFSLYRVGQTASIYMYMFMADDISKSSNSLIAFEAAATVIRGLVDGSVRAFFSPRSFLLNNDL